MLRSARGCGIPQWIGERDRPEELDAALDVLRRRCRTAPASERERALAMLVRRGYELELAYDAVRAFERWWSSQVPASRSVGVS